MGNGLDRKTPALALSGGGFRATLFHCGAMKRLNELSLLSKFTRISSVSGGSIAAGKLAVEWPTLNRDGDRFTNLEEKVIEPLRAFCRRNIDEKAVLWGTLHFGKAIGDVLADYYDEMFAYRTLRDLPDAPQFVFNATNLQTGRLVRISKSGIREWTIGHIEVPDLRISKAVAASSAFPPVLSPVEIDLDPANWTMLKGAEHFGDPDYARRLSLTDGGAYDNLGLETVDDFDPVVVSDAGAPFGTEPSASGFWPKQAMRALDIATDQARALRKRLLFAEARNKGRQAVYAGIDSDPGEYPATSALATDRALLRSLARIRTRLDPFSDSEQGHLINWGWLAMDIAVRSYWDTGAPSPCAWPEPGFPLGRG